MSSRPSRLLVAIAAAITALALGASLASAAALLGPKQPKMPRTHILRPVPAHPSVGVITLKPEVPSGAQAQANKAAQKRLEKANPDLRSKATPKVRNPYTGPTIGAPTPGVQDGTADQGGGTIAGPGTQAGGSGGVPIIRGAMRGNAHREMASGDLSAFRVSTVTDPSNAGAGAGPSWIGEPTVANDRNAMLFTANWYSAYSSDNGRTWGYIDPSVAFPKLDGGFCCDQYAVSIPRDGYNNIAWIMQNAATTTRNSYRLVVLKNRSGIEALDGTLEYCSYVIDSTDFSLPKNSMLDYPAMQATSKYLYLSANAGLIGGSVVDRGVVWRIALSGLETCSGTPQGVVLDDQMTLRPVNGAGGTMYFGSLPLFGDTFGKKFDINWISDSSTTLHYKQKNVTNWATGDMTCPLASTSTNDPCGRINPMKVLAGFKTSSRVGWMFMAGTGSSSTDYPYTRVVRFNPSTLALEAETDIWNDEFAWGFPSSGITSRGDVGGMLIEVGGTYNPKAAAFISDDLSDWSPLAMIGVTASDGAPNGACSPANRNAQCLGDYFTASAYTGCSNSLLATTIVEETVGTTAGPAHRVAWFGRERDGCVDMQVSGVTAGPVSGSTDPLRGGGTMAVGDTTWNTGSTAVGGTTTTYYLSRDTALSGADVRLGDRAVGSLAAGGSSLAINQVVTLPDGAFGTYVVIACADDPSTVDEVSDTNNCAASDAVQLGWTINRGFVLTSPMWDRSVSDTRVVGAITPGARIVVGASGRITPVVDPASPITPDLTKAPEALPWDVFLTVDKRITSTAKPIGKIPMGPIKTIPLPGGPLKQWMGSAKATLRLPSIMPPGRYWLHVCAPVQLDDPQPATNCSTVKKPLIPKVR